MSRTKDENDTARLEARIPAHVYDTMQRAARLRGMTLTGYLLATAGEDARRVVEEAEVMRMAREDQVRFAEALVDPPKPNARLVRAAKRHRRVIPRSPLSSSAGWRATATLRASVWAGYCCSMPSAPWRPRR